MDNNGNWPLIAKHLTQSATAEEERELTAWAGSSAENKQKLEDAERIWKLTEGEPVPAIDSEKEWIALLKRIEADARLRDPDSHRELWPNSLSWPSVLKVAAAILLLVTIYFVFFRKSGAVKELVKEEVPLAVVIPRDTITSESIVLHIFLSDSSSVWLNQHSRLIFDHAFNRRVSLTGEALFEIRPDAVPFEVETANTRTRVLGTIFNVKAREHQAEEVNVMKGKVEFGGSDSSETKLVLQANERAAYDSASHNTERRQFDKNATAWMRENNPVFDNEAAKPIQYVKNVYTWKKNVINETMIDGTITNNARLAAYGKIKLKIQYTTAKGKKNQVYLTLLTNEVLRPGQSIPYHQTLFDVFSKKTDVTISIDKIDFVQ